MPVAGQRPLGQQVVGGDRPGCLGQPDAARAGSGGAGRAGAAPGRPPPGPITTGPGAEVVGDHRGRRPCRGRSTPPSTTTSRSPCTAHSASIAGGRGATPAYLVEDVGLRAPLGACARARPRPSRGLPAERAGRESNSLVGLAAEHRVDDQRLEPGVPGAAHLGGPGVDLGGGERDLARSSAAWPRARRRRRRARAARRRPPRRRRWSSAPARRSGAG